MLRATLSAVVLALSYVAGHLLKSVVRRRLTAMAAGTSGQWDDVLVTELGKRVPLWCGLLGVYLAAGFWTLPPNVNNALTKSLFVLIVLSATFSAAAIVAWATRAYGSTLQHALPLTSLTQTVVTGAVYTLGLLMILNGLGVSVTPILTALGVGGLAVALALQETLSNLFAGIYVAIAGLVRTGDYVRLDSGEEGYVADIGWRSTRIRLLANNMVLVPNARLAQAIVTNYYMPDCELAVLVEVGVDYASDLTRVERITCEVAKETLETVPGGIASFAPFIRYHTFGDSSINFTVILRAREYVDQYLLKHEFIKRLHERYTREGITIPFPIRTLVWQDGDQESPAPVLK